MGSLMTPIKLIRHKRKCPSLLSSLFWLLATQIQLTTFLNWKKRKITQITVKALAITCKAVTLAKVESNSWPTENAKALPIPSNSKPIDEDLQFKLRELKSMEIVAGSSRRDNIVGSKTSLVVLNQPSTSTSTME